MDLKARLHHIYGDASHRPRQRSAEPGGPSPSTDLLDSLGGQWEERASGTVLSVHREFPGEHRHGHFSLETIYSTPASLVYQLCGDPSFMGFDPESTVFMDTETTGLSGGTGTYVFLVGLGYFRQNTFQTRQFFLTDLESEGAFLEEISGYLESEAPNSGYSFLVSFNGKSYDLNLLNYRFVLQRQENPFQAFSHLDLLYPSRLLWKGCFEDCRLQTLEQRILGVQRRDDIPSHLIPRAYFSYLHSGQYRPFSRIFEHNRVDLLSMVTLLVQAGRLLEEPEERFFVDPGRAAHLYSLRGHYEKAATLLELLCRQQRWRSRKLDLLCQLASLKKKMGYMEQALSLYREVIDEHPRPPREAFAEAAKILEHEGKDFESALHIVCRDSNITPAGASSIGVSDWSVECPEPDGIEPSGQPFDSEPELTTV